MGALQKMMARVCVALLLIAAIGVHCEDVAALNDMEDVVSLPVNDPHYLDYTVQLIDEWDQGMKDAKAKIIKQGVKAAAKAEKKAVKVEKKKAATKKEEAAEEKTKAKAQEKKAAAKKKD